MASGYGKEARDARVHINCTVSLPVAGSLDVHQGVGVHEGGPGGQGVHGHNQADADLP